MAKTQVREQKIKTATKTKEEEITSVNTDTKDLKKEMDSLLKDIDEVLEENMLVAEEFTQKGGQ